MIKTILFDLGGVIYQHPKEIIPKVISQIFNQPFEKTIRVYEKYKEDYFTGKLATNSLIISLCSSYKCSKSIDEIKELWLKYYSKLAHPNNKVLDIVKKLQRNYKIYLFSNTTEMSHIHNKKTRIYDFFDDIFLSFKMNMKKPDKVIYKKVISVIKFKPSDCLFIDDDLKNLIPAEQLGMKTILFNILTEAPEKLIEELRKFKINLLPSF